MEAEKPGQFMRQRHTRIDDQRARALRAAMDRRGREDRDDPDRLSIRDAMDIIE